MAIERMKPFMSIARGFGSFDDGIKNAPNANAIIPTGKLTKNTEPQ